jgi:Na+-translocating ferredoxin:NAD+ oxidoreductase RnfC subunit
MGGESMNNGWTQEIDRLRARVAELKEKELRKCAVCNLCGKKTGESGIPLFWRVKIERLRLKKLQHLMRILLFANNYENSFRALNNFRGRRKKI